MRFQKQLFVTLAVLFFASTIFPTLRPQTASAVTGSDFNAARITDDVVFFGTGSMDIPTIQSFLNSKVPICDTNGAKAYGNTSRAAYGTSKGYPPPYTCLKDYSTVTVAKTAEAGLCDGYAATTQTAAQIIYGVAQSCGVSPKALIVLLQKEQALVTDDWPWSSQYQKATGYGCPDTAPCNAQYYGFFNQVYSAARQFKNYVLNSTNFGYRAGRSNYIQYNPNAGCGGTNVIIQNGATAALYNYTPYQPNAAALNNLYGTGDSCSAYGNRNYWRYYNDWFGPTLTDVVYAQANDGSSAQYLIYDGKKQQIASYNALLAWGIPRLPLQYFTPQVLASIPNHETALTRFATPSMSGNYYFIDSSNSYSVDSNDRNIWANFRSEPVSIITSKVLQLTSLKGGLPNIAYRDSDPNIYLVDQGYLHQITSPTVLRAWAGSSPKMIKISSEYSSDMPIGITLNNPQLLYGGKPYFVSPGVLNQVSNSVQPLLPNWTSIAVGSGTFKKFQQGTSLQHLIRGTGQSAIYLLNSTQKHSISSFDVFNAFRTSGSMYETAVSPDSLSLIPSGTAISSSLVTIANKTYSLEHSLHEIPTNLQAAYNAAGLAVPLDSTFDSIFTVGAQATRYIKSPSGAGIFFLDNGKRYPINQLNTYTLIGGSGKETVISTDILNTYPIQQAMKPYVTDGSNNYVIENNTKHLVANATVQAAWELGSPLTLSPDAVNTFATSTAVTQHVQTPNGEFCLVDGGRRWCAEQFDMIFTWGLTGGLSKPSQALINYYDIERAGALANFSSGYHNAPYGNAVFVSGKGGLWGIASPVTLANLGYASKITPLSAQTIESMHGNTQTVHPFLISDDSQNVWVIDNGRKRPIPSSLVPLWTNTQSPTSLGTNFLDQLPTESAVTKSVTAPSTGTIFGISDGKKYGITTYQKYISGGYSPYTEISNTLLSLIPYVGDI